MTISTIHAVHYTNVASGCLTSGGVQKTNSDVSELDILVLQIRMPVLK